MATKEAQKAWRDRRRAGKIRNDFCQCGRKLRTESKDVCFHCWLKTPEGKAYNQEQVARSKQKLDLVEEAKAIASKFSSELGFVNKAALAESQEKGCLDVIPGIGFAHWHHRRNGQTTIYSLAVNRDFQGQGWGRLLFYRVLCSAVEFRNRRSPKENRFTVLAKCPEDLPSNEFYRSTGFSLASVEPGKKRRLNVWVYQFELPLLFYCGGGGASQYDRVADEEGWRLGLRSSGQNKAHRHMQMIDCMWDDPERGLFYKHEQHLKLVKEQKPLVATVRDIMTLEQLPEALKQAREIAQYCGRVILIPKVKCWLPDRYWLGYSIPTGHGETSIEPKWFSDRFTHILGGDANDQAKYAKHLNTVSLDHNAAMRIAQYGKAMHQYCSDNGEFVGKGCYESLRVSLNRQKHYWHEDIWDRKIDRLNLFDILMRNCEESQDL